MRQLALLFGNNDYPDAELKNAANDAKAMAAKLTELGFACIVKTNASAKSMDRNLAIFGEQLKGNDVGLVFFAGHGMQIDGINYLTAVDTDFGSEVDAKFSSLPLDKVILTMEKANNRTNILLLDACRNNPYERRWRGGPRGLAPVYAPKGMIVAYATSPGQVASDGANGNGAYTHALLTHIAHQDLPIESFFKRVRNTLSSSTAGKQISWEHTSLMGDYYFNHSTSGGVLISAYSDSALADANFRARRRAVAEIIDGLKSHDWYQQNPAISKLTSKRLEDASKDECFVLGRNVYQAACGGSNEAEDFLRSLSTKLGRLPDEVGFHLLNGMLYEIYFDSHGRKRDQAKSGHLDDVFALESDEDFEDSFEFIDRALRPYAAELFYVPGASKDLSVDVVLKRYGKDRVAISKVCIDGENVLYDDLGESFFVLSDDAFLSKVSGEDFRRQLAAALVAPSDRLKINYVGQPLSDDRLLTPTLNLRRVSTT